MLAGQTAHSLHRSPGRNGAALQPWCGLQPYTCVTAQKTCSSLTRACGDRRSACRRCRLHSTRRRLLAVAQRPRCANEAGGEAHAWRQRAGALAAALCLAAHAPALAGEVVRASVSRPRRCSVQDTGGALLSTVRARAGARRRAARGGSRRRWLAWRGCWTLATQSPATPSPYSAACGAPPPAARPPRLVLLAA